MRRAEHVRWSTRAGMGGMSFGRALFLEPDGTPRSESAYGERFLFTGREYLAPVGLCDYRHRADSPTLGRFLQVDPFNFAGGDVSLYRCCVNNPVINIDPLGLRDVTITFYHNLGHALTRGAMKEVERIYRDAFTRYGNTKKHTLRFEWRQVEKCPEKDKRGYGGGNFFGFNPTRVGFYRQVDNRMPWTAYNPRRWVISINVDMLSCSACVYDVAMGVVIAHESGLHGIANRTDFFRPLRGFVDANNPPSSGSPVFSDRMARAIVDALDLE